MKALPAMNYARIAEKYDAYVTTTFDIPFFLEKARGRVLAILLRKLEDRGLAAATSPFMIWELRP